MSGEVIGYRNIRKCRKNHICFWCGEKILKGDPYTRWAWVDGSIDVVKVHPECRDAWNKASDEEGYPYEAIAYEHKRGSYYE